MCLQSNAYALSTRRACFFSKLRTQFVVIFGECFLEFCFDFLKEDRERPDTIRSIVANLVGDDDSGDSLVDESEPIQPLQHADAENYSDPNWEPEPIDAGPGECENYHQIN